jgi:predicted anti-sigma-YlaC factor YlaD
MGANTMDINNCRGMLGELSDYLDRTLSDDFCQEIEEHMARCEDCRIVVDTLQKTILLYQQLPQPEISYEARDRLYHSLDLTEYLNGQA